MENEAPQPQGSLSDQQRVDYRAALVHIGADKACARCGTEGRHGIIPASAPLNLFRIDEAISGVQELLLETIVVSCLHCGAITMHSKGVLDRAVKSLKAQINE